MELQKKTFAKIKVERLAKYNAKELAEKSGMSYDAIRVMKRSGSCRRKTKHKVLAAMREIDKIKVVNNGGNA